EAMCAGKAFDKNLQLIVTIAPDVPRRVRTDPTRLRQVLLNLVSNAIKFTNPGEVRVELSRRCGAGEMAGLRFVVSDTGIGIDDEQLSRLFEPFTQGDVSTTRRFGGTGLGLAICKRLVEMMRGHIVVCSEPGKGARFEVTIDAPLSGIAPTAPAAAALALRPGLRVLLAEDGPDNQRLIAFYLQHAGIEYDVADNGRIAVDRAIAADAAGRPFDLVLMDMQMPELDGVAATAALRAAGFKIPIIALTAHSTEEAHLQSLRAGCCEHMVKPVNHDTLMHAIATHTAPAAVAADSAVLTSQLSGDPRFKALMDGYVAELPDQVSALIELSRGERDIALRRLLHQIKGAGGGYGLSALSSAAAAAQAAFDESDVNSLTKSVDQLIRLMRSVQGYDSGRERLHAAARIDH
ncbi:MAG: histidine kinase, partial [Phycisphaerales bacterium]|nr:histidine kinase [Phycisphaerales bacterium]